MLSEGTEKVRDKMSRSQQQTIVKKKAAAPTAIAKSLSFQTQSVLFSKDRFLTFERASQKAEELGLNLKTFEERQGAFVFIQRGHSEFKELSLQTIQIEDGVSAVIGILTNNAVVSDMPQVSLTPEAVNQGTVDNQPLPIKENTISEMDAFAKVETAQTMGYVFMSEEQGQTLKNLKDEFAKQVAALKSVASTVAAPVAEFLEINTKSFHDAAQTLADHIITEMILIQQAADLIAVDVQVQIDKSLEEELNVIKSNEELVSALNILSEMLEPVIEIFKDTSFDKFHELCEATAISINKFVEIISVDKSLIPMPDMTREELKLAQEARARKWDIEIVDGSSLSFPEGFPTNLEQYGDPVNLKFPFESMEQAKSARVRFKQFANEIYAKTSSKETVHTRIVLKELAFGITVLLDENDELDKLLPEDLWTLENVMVRAEATVEKNVFVPILKASEEERTVFGIVLEPDVVDIHKDTYSGDEIVKAAHHFMEKMQNIGKNHTELINDDVRILESYCAPVDMKLETPSGKVEIKKNTWLMKVRCVSDAIWKQVKSGELTGFSIGALCTVERLKETE